MLAQFLHILLSVSLLVCPALCGRGACECATMCEAPQACQESCGDCACSGEESHCRNDCAAEQRPVDEPEQPLGDSCDSCQCICDGATTEDALEVVPLLRVNSPLDLPPAVTSPSLSPAAPSLLTAPGPDEGPVVAGRDLCCRHMSYLC